MGKIRLVTDEPPDLSWKPPPRKPGDPPYVPLPGVSVRAVIGWLNRKLGGYSDDGPVNRVYFELGNALEDALVYRLLSREPGRFMRVPTITADGLKGRPDLIDLDEWAVDEFKCTWASVNHPPESDKHWPWWVQVKAYCHMFGAEVGRLRVYHVVGDWKGSGPQYREWEQRFGREELRENWTMLKQNAERMRAGDG